MYRLTLLLLVLGLCVSAVSAQSLRTRVEHFEKLHRGDGATCEILFQSFPWDANVNGQKHVWYRHLQSKAANLSQVGVTHVWFPPPQRSVAPQGYMPGDWYDLGHGQELSHNRTLYGNKEELKACIDAFHDKDIKCIGDIVVNHRCGSHQDNQGNWNIYHFPSGKAKWEQWAIVAGDTGGQGANDTGGDFGAAPDVDHTNERVRQDIIDWLNWLKSEVGFDGWRFDYTKGYGGEYAGEYVEQTSACFSVGELWTDMNYNGSYMLPDQNSHRQALCDWLDAANGVVRTFDFTTKGQLQVACKTGEYWRLRDSEGKASGLIGWWPDRAVTFIDNHDTGSLQAHWPFPGDKVLQGYAYILTHPGTPTIFWEHLYTWGDNHHKAIKEMAQLRTELGISRTSMLNILIAEQNRYVAQIDGKCLVKLGSGQYSPDGEWQLRHSGNDYAIWSK